jgi:DNA excision repair protein ERCC-5
MHCKISHYAICFLVPFLQSGRKRKQVTYMEDGDEAESNDAHAPLHQNDENNPGEAAANTDIVDQDTESNLVHQDVSELNSNQMHTDTGTAEDVNGDLQGFELHEDHLADSAPKDYLFTGGGFCMQDGDGQEPAGDVCGAELEPGTSDPGDDMIGLSDSGKSASLSTAGVYRECRHGGTRCIFIAAGRQDKLWSERHANTCQA